MARPRVDFRKLFRQLGSEVQDANARRLLAGLGVSGGQLAPLAPDARGVTRTARGAVRLTERRIGVTPAAGTAGRTPGIRTGKLLRDLTRRSNIRVTRTGFRIVPSLSAARTLARAAADVRRLARGVAGKWGIAAERLERAREQTTIRAYFALQMGRAGAQPARPFSGIDDALMRRADELIGVEGRDQIAASMQAAAERRSQFREAFARGELAGRGQSSAEQIGRALEAPGLEDVSAGALEERLSGLQSYTGL